MNKKGLAWGMIVTAIIAILVLVILVWIFREQLTGISEQFLNVIKQTSASSKDFSEEIKNLNP
ncbi:MAG: hypothetical protein KKG75_00595 [Nanoarchaeota archaeon]|nr:hypothetical protein [Nanoarchaeota archaeon]